MASPSLRDPARARLRQLRVEAGIEQFELAAVLRVDPTDISRFETGHGRHGNKLPRGLGADDYLAALERLRALDWNEVATALGVPVREVPLVRRRDRRRLDYLEVLRRLAGVPEPAA